jgi:hypothetical protein
MDFWRGEAYSSFFEYLDRRGGFYYEVNVVPLFSASQTRTENGLYEPALGRRTCALDRRGAIRGNGPHALFPRNRVRARSVHTLSHRAGNLGAKSLHV